MTGTFKDIAYKRYNFNLTFVDNGSFPELIIPFTNIVQPITILVTEEMFPGSFPAVSMLSVYCILNQMNDDPHISPVLMFPSSVLPGAVPQPLL